MDSRIEKRIRKEVKKKKKKKDGSVQYISKRKRKVYIIIQKVIVSLDSTESTNMSMPYRVYYIHCTTNKNQKSENYGTVLYDEINNIIFICI